MLAIQSARPTSRHAVLGVFWGTVERAVTQGAAFVVVLVLARLLGPENYGLVTLAATMALFQQTLLGETFSQAVIQQKHLEPAHVSSLFWLLAALGLVAAGAQVLAAGPLALLFGEPAVAPLLRALSPLPVLSALQAVPLALLKRDLDFRAIAAASSTGTILGGAIGVGMAYAGFGVWSLVANLLIQNAIVTASIWRQSRFRPAAIFSGVHIGDLWAYGQYTFLLRLAAFAANQSPRLIVGYLFGPAALGAFSLGLRIVEIGYQLLALPAANVVAAMIARLRDEPARLEKAILSATQLSAMVSVPVFVALVLLAPLGVPFVFGAKWSASIPIIQILCAYGVVGGCGLVWGSIITGLGRPDLSLITTTAAAVVTVVTLLIAARWGLAAASAAFVIRGYATLPFMPLMIARLTGISAAKQYRVYVPILLAAFAMAAVAEGMIAALADAVTPLALACLVLTAAVTVYACALCIFARGPLQRGVAVLAQLRPRPRAVRP